MHKNTLLKLGSASITIYLLFSGTLTIAAQQRGQRKTTQKKVAAPRLPAEKQAMESRYSTQSFDLSLSSLPNNFRGHNAIDIYKALEKRNATSTKGEFETTEAYRRRMESETNEILLGSLTRHSVFAFVIERLESEYDADRQILRVKAELSRVREGVTLRENEKDLLWKIIDRDRSSYIGTNAYGAKVKVDRNDSDFYEIAFANYSQFPVIRYLDKFQQQLEDDEKKLSEKYGLPPPQRYTLTDDRETAFAADLTMDAPMAMKAKNNLRLLLVCRLTTPNTIEGGMYDKPTIDRPHEYFIKNYDLNTELLELWFFDFPTGQVYAKQKPR
jgi:hypothetical protein